jgi:hypothetical protein
MVSLGGTLLAQLFGTTGGPMIRDSRTASTASLVTHASSFITTVRLIWGVEPAARAPEVAAPDANHHPHALRV